MNTLRLLAMGAALLTGGALVSGCGGASSAIISAPAAAFAGTYSGTSAGDNPISVSQPVGPSTVDLKGFFTLIVRPDGSVSGRLYPTALSSDSPLSGTVDGAGNFVVSTPSTDFIQTMKGHIALGTGVPTLSGTFALQSVSPPGPAYQGTNYGSYSPFQGTGTIRATRTSTTSTPTPTATPDPTRGTYNGTFSGSDPKSGTTTGTLTVGVVQPGPRSPTDAPLRQVQALVTFTSGAYTNATNVTFSALGTLDNAGHFVLPLHMEGAATNTDTLTGTIAPSGASVSGTYAINNDTFGSSKGTFSGTHVNFGR